MQICKRQKFGNHRLEYQYIIPSKKKCCKWYSQNALRARLAVICLFHSGIIDLRHQSRISTIEDAFEPETEWKEIRRWKKYEN